MPPHDCTKEEELSRMWGKIGSASVWRVAFWIMAVFLTIVDAPLIGAVISNDRMRATEDQRIETMIYQKYDVMISKLNELSGDVREIKTSLKNQTNQTNETYNQKGS